MMISHELRFVGPAGRGGAVAVVGTVLLSVCGTESCHWVCLITQVGAEDDDGELEHHGPPRCPHLARLPVRAPHHAREETDLLGAPHIGSQAG
jgi:hypothetical protein